MFKNYHIVVFKDREGGVKNLRLRGWLGIFLLLLVVGLSGLNAYLWTFYNKTATLERELDETRRQVRAGDSQLLSLSGKMRTLEEDVRRVQQFDSKLRVLMNAEPDSANEDANNFNPSTAPGRAAQTPTYLARYRDLYVRQLHNLVDELSTNILLEEVEQQTLVSHMRLNKDLLLSTPSIWPTKGYLTSGFGWRRSPFSGASAMHKGLDIANRVGTPVSAPARGAVTFSGADGAYGISVTISHGVGIVTRYAHLSKALVKVGDYVQRGEVIGAVGNTGRSTGPHLHYEVIVNNTPVDPMRYILN